MAAPLQSLDARPRPYRRYLTSAFHSRFIHASSVALIVAFDNAFWIADKRNIWSWFPIGPALPKIILLFFTSLFIFILHVATLNIGRSTATSPFMTLRSKLLSISTFQTFFWYIVSAWWFSEIYIWSSAQSADLGWVIKGGMSSPDRLNERPIYLRAIFFSLALVQSCRHIYHDRSCLHLPITMPSKLASKGIRTHPLDPISKKMQITAVPTLANSIVISATVAIFGPFYYTLFMRQTLWWLHLQMAKPIFNLSRSNARPTGYPPSNILLIVRSFTAAYLLILTWETTSFLFSAYLLQEPSKKNQPLTAASRDPNGTLANGLKTKKDVVKTFAFWELALIAQRFPDRRKAIFADIERPEGPRWTQMLQAGLKVVEGIDARIVAQKCILQAAPMQETAQPPVTTLPRIAPDISQKAITMDSPKPSSGRGQVKAAVGAGLKRMGQSQQPWTPPVGKARGLLQYVTPPGAESAQSASLIEQWWGFLQSSHIGWFFTTTAERRVCALVLGSPHSDAALIVDAVEGLTKMLVASLAEDLYGKAIAGVPETVRVFTNGINAIETLLKQQRAMLNKENISEVNIVLSCLKLALAELLSAFQLYLSDTGLGVRELSDAKKAAEKEVIEKNEKMTYDSEPLTQDENGKKAERRSLFDRVYERQQSRAFLLPATVEPSPTTARIAPAHTPEMQEQDRDVSGKPAGQVKFFDRPRERQRATYKPVRVETAPSAAYLPPLR